MNREALLNYIAENIESQITELKLEIDSILNEMGEETKSSAGDKFETSREMMNQERDRLENRLSHLNENRRLVESLKNQSLTDSIGLGSLVKTDSTLFLFGLALGKIIFDKQDLFVLSLNSPIGKMFFGKKLGDKVQFSDKVYHIKSIK